MVIVSRMEMMRNQNMGEDNKELKDRNREMGLMKRDASWKASGRRIVLFQLELFNCSWGTLIR